MEIEKRRNCDLQANYVQKTQEVGHLQKILNNFRGSMDHHVQDVENVIEKNLAISKVANRKNENKVVQNLAADSTFATADLGLSSDNSSAGNSPLPTDPPDNASKHIPDYERILPIDSKSETSLFDQGTLKLSEEVDDDRDSAIGNSESHTLMPVIPHINQQNKEDHFKGKFLPVNNISNKDIREQNVQIRQNPKVSLGEQIKALHQASQEEKTKQLMNTRDIQEDTIKNNEYQQKLNLSETFDSERLETTNIKTRLDDVTPQDEKTLRGVNNSNSDKVQTNAHSNSKSTKEMLPENQPSTINVGSGGKKLTEKNSMKRHVISKDIKDSDDALEGAVIRHEIDRR